MKGATKHIINLKVKQESLLAGFICQTALHLFFNEEILKNEKSDSRSEGRKRFLKIISMYLSNKMQPNVLKKYILILNLNL